MKRKNLDSRKGAAPPSVLLIAFGAILILVGVVTTPVFFDFGNAAFWLGVLVLALGILALFFK